MIYKQLSPKQTSFWLSNIDKTIKILEDLKDYYFNILDKKTKDEFEKHYTNWYNFVSYDDLIYLKDGKHYIFSWFSFRPLSKLTQYSEYERNITSYVIYKHKSTKLVDDYKKLIETKQYWKKYAEQPFQINMDDLKLYYSFKEVHEKVKIMLKGVGAYNEALDLDEDS